MAYKMKGSEFYGKMKLNRNMDDSSNPDGRAKSSAFQKEGTGSSPVKGRMWDEIKAGKWKEAGRTLKDEAKARLKGLSEHKGYTIASSRYADKMAYERKKKELAKIRREEVGKKKSSPAKRADVIIDGENIGTGEDARKRAIAHDIKTRKKFLKDRKDESVPGWKKTKLANIEYTDEDKKVMESPKGEQEYWEGVRKANPELRKYKTKADYDKMRDERKAAVKDSPVEMHKGKPHMEGVKMDRLKKPQTTMDRLKKPGEMDRLKKPQTKTSEMDPLKKPKQTKS